MEIYQVDETERFVGKKLQKGNLTKWRVDKMASWQKGKSMEEQIDETASW